MYEVSPCGGVTAQGLTILRSSAVSLQFTLGFKQYAGISFQIGGGGDCLLLCNP